MAREKVILAAYPAPHAFAKVRADGTEYACYIASYTAKRSSAQELFSSMAASFTGPEQENRGVPAVFAATRIDNDGPLGR